MKSLILVTALLSATTMSTYASDLMRPQAPAAYADPVSYDWTGFYVGGNAGVVSSNATTSDNSATNTDPLGVFIPLGTFGSPGTSTSFSGFAGGVQAGYNWQAGDFVVGIEGDIQGVNALSTVDVAPLVPGGPSQVNTVRISNIGTARVRLGYAVESLLFYATGGLAMAGVEATNTLNSGFVPGTSATGSDSQTLYGWTIGAGVEAGLGDSNWTVRAEYLYADFGPQTHTFGLTPGLTTTSSVNVNAHIIRAGVNYRF